MTEYLYQLHVAEFGFLCYFVCYKYEVYLLFTALNSQQGLGDGEREYEVYKVQFSILTSLLLFTGFKNTATLSITAFPQCFWIAS